MDETSRCVAFFQDRRDKEDLRIALQGVAQGLAPRRKNSTALAARSTSLCGP